MRRLFNYRPLCFTALALALGIIAAQAFLSVEPLYRLLPLLLFAVGTVLTFIFKKSRRFAYLPIVFIMGLLEIFGGYDIYNSKTFGSYSGAFYATVKSEVVSNDVSTRFYVNDVTVNGETLDGECSVVIYGGFTPDFGAGDKVEIKGKLSRAEYKAFDSYFAYSSLSGRTLYAYANGANLVSEGNSKFFDSISMSVKRMFYENTSEYTSALCQALVFGDKFGIDSDLYSDIRSTGLVHLFAVSGLNFTTLAGALYWLLKKCRIKGWISFALVTALTFVYAMMCSFTPSVMRAFVMVAVLSFSANFGRKYDGMSALGFAAVLLLLVNPLSLFDVGFLLSFSAMLGLMLFCRPISNAFVKFNNFIVRPFERKSLKNSAGASEGTNPAVAINDYPAPKPAVNIYAASNGFKAQKARGKYVADLAAGTLGANITTLPFVAYFFGAVPTFFFISNLIGVPYMMFIYMILLLITVFAQLTTLWGIVGVMDIFMYPFEKFIAAAGSVDFAMISLAISAVSIVGWLISAVLTSNYIFFTRRKRIAAVSATLTVTLVLSVLFVALGV